MITWLVIGLAAAAAVGILAFWDEIVEWVEDVFNRIAYRVARAWATIQFNGYKLITRVRSFFGRTIKEEDKTEKPITREDIEKMYEEGIITYEEKEKLLRGEEITKSKFDR